MPTCILKGWPKHYFKVNIKFIHSFDCLKIIFLSVKVYISEIWHFKQIIEQKFFFKYFKNTVYG